MIGAIGGRRRTSAVWSPAALYSGGKLGAWFKVGDLSTLFQDSAGTTPVTATGQPIGKITDKSGNGAHATQPTSTARPVIPSAGYRLRSDFTDDFLSVTLGAQCEVWINTPYGCQRGFGGPSMRLPLCDVTEVIAVQGTLTSDERTAIKTYFGTAEKYWLNMLSSTKLNRTKLQTSSTVDVLFIGANGASTTLTYSGATEHNDELSGYGLTAPVLAVLPLSLATNTSLSNFKFIDTSASALLPDISGNTGLSGGGARFDNASGYVGAIPDMSALTAMTAVQMQSNQIMGVASGFAVPAALVIANLSNNVLVQSAVDAILAAFVAAGATGGTLNVGGSGNASPSATGLTDKSTLVSRGWTVTTN